MPHIKVPLEWFQHRGQLQNTVHKAVSPLTVQLWFPINTPHYQLSVCGSELTDAIYEDRGNTLSVSLLHLWHYMRYVETK